MRALRVQYEYEYEYLFVLVPGCVLFIVTTSTYRGKRARKFVPRQLSGRPKLLVVPYGIVRTLYRPYTRHATTYSYEGTNSYLYRGRPRVPRTRLIMHGRDRATIFAGSNLGYWVRDRVPRRYCFYTGLSFYYYYSTTAIRFARDQYKVIFSATDQR